ncbi:hypothetical protein DFA_06999 [Cavenderia fasciculata]|uniref:Uncharacterized protein n=1 Tax=Cavenderia fasciculata TaxID=261658 RepID=F4PX92_CACFS|nr:uncharacterized protein DFA_06999 [Cavenderia fasciculata]EGG19895.1 hypothetical protein DFA_06999 [Cavenderia fasciculata]|eukprot:XP_004366878.1 hypothetical protein DFA_06999 [Cavenderia fasciculata]
MIGSQPPINVGGVFKRQIHNYIIMYMKSIIVFLFAAFALATAANSYTNFAGTFEVASLPTDAQASAQALSGGATATFEDDGSSYTISYKISFNTTTADFTAANITGISVFNPSAPGTVPSGVTGTAIPLAMNGTGITVNGLNFQAVGSFVVGNPTYSVVKQQVQKVANADSTAQFFVVVYYGGNATSDPVPASRSQLKWENNDAPAGSDSGDSSKVAISFGLVLLSSVFALLF